MLTLYAALHVTIGPRIGLSSWRVEPGGNAALEEALQWKQGRLDLELNDYEVAHVEGKRYNVVGLAFTILSVAATTLNNLAGGRPDEFFASYFVASVYLPLPVVAFWALRRATGSSVHAALLSFGMIVGTGLQLVLAVCRTGSIYYINNVLAVTGLLLMAGELLGARRIWPAAIGLMLAGWSRQMTSLYALPMLWIAWRYTPSQSRRAFCLAAGAVVILAVVPMGLAWAKLGHPLYTGYYEMNLTRGDEVGRRAREAVFSPRYIPMHLRAMNVEFPSWDIRGGRLYPVMDHLQGGSIWLTTPLFLAVPLTIRRWWRDPARRALMFGSLLVMLGLTCYHTTGSQVSGHYRYALDFLPIWLMVVAPYFNTPRALWWVVGCLGYSAVYFAVMP